MTIINFKSNTKATVTAEKNLSILIAVCDSAMQPRNLNLTKNLIPDICDHLSVNLLLFNMATLLSLMRDLLETYYETVSSLSPDFRNQLNYAVIQLDDPTEPTIRLTIPSPKYTYTVIFGKWGKEFYLVNYFTDGVSVFNNPLTVIKGDQLDE